MSFSPRFVTFIVSLMSRVSRAVKQSQSGHTWRSFYFVCVYFIWYINMHLFDGPGWVEEEERWSFCFFFKFFLLLNFQLSTFVFYFSILGLVRNGGKCLGAFSIWDDVYAVAMNCGVCDIISYKLFRPFAVGFSFSLSLFPSFFFS